MTLIEKENCLEMAEKNTEKNERRKYEKNITEKDIRKNNLNNR